MGKTSDKKKVKKKLRKLEKKLERYKRKIRESPDRSVQDESTSPEGEPSPIVLMEELPVAPNCQDELDTATLEAFGGSSGQERKYGDPVHEELYTRSKKILLDGLLKEEKENLAESCLIPKNCILLDAPILNPELECVLSEPQRSRDQRLRLRQQELGLIMGAILKSSHLLCKKEFNKSEVVKILCEASRLSANMHFQYTDIRRKLIAPNLDKNLQAVLSSNKRDEHLYSQLAENNKSCNVLKRVSTNISKTATKRPQQKNYQPPRLLDTQRKASFRGGPALTQPARGGIRQRPAQRGRAYYQPQRARYP